MPPVLVFVKGQPWQGVGGLFVSGIGFLLIAVGVWQGGQDWNGVVIAGVMIAFFGQMIQKQMTRAIQREQREAKRERDGEG